MATIGIGPQSDCQNPSLARSLRAKGPLRAHFRQEVLLSDTVGRSACGPAAQREPPRLDAPDVSRILAPHHQSFAGKFGDQVLYHLSVWLVLLLLLRLGLADLCRLFPLAEPQRPRAQPTPAKRPHALRPRTPDDCLAYHDTVNYPCQPRPHRSLPGAPGNVGAAAARQSTRKAMPVRTRIANIRA